MTGKKMKINVIDLDRTLLPYSSLIRFVWLFERDRRFVGHLFLNSILWIIGFISTGIYLKKVLMAARRSPDYENKAERFGRSLQKDIRGSVLGLVLKNTDGHTINVICTGSPEDYVKHLSKALGWEHISTTLSGDLAHYVHMGGKAKYIVLNERYPKQKYRYNLAISDNIADSGLLRKFGTSYRIKNRMLTKGFRLIRVK